jgi:hypothetical protein
VKAAGKRHYLAWAKLTEALRDGKPKAGDDDPKLFDTIYANPEQGGPDLRGRTAFPSRHQRRSGVLSRKQDANGRSSFFGTPMP